MKLELSKKLDLDDVVNAPNVADLLDKNDLPLISTLVSANYEADKSSREQWETDMANALKLALQVTETKSEPWLGAANVMFPMVTIAALQFHARIYPMLIPGPDVAKCRVIGTMDPLKQSSSDRIGRHMSWQLLEQDETWEPEHDKSLLVMGIMGCVFKRSYFDSRLGHIVGKMVSPADLVLDYFTTDDVNMAARATYRFSLSRNEIREYEIKGFYCEHEDANYSGTLPTDPIRAVADDRQGLTSPALAATDDRVRMLEQLCWLDLDCDGYAEPYVVTFEEESGRLRRIVARFFTTDIQYGGKKEKQITRIDPTPIYTKYELIPAPDGGFYGLGFGRLLGPLNHSVNTMLNQLIDSGTLSNYGGGFLGRGARFRGGQTTFKPQEWKQVDAPGDDLRKNIVPLPVREPSKILFDLMTYLVGYGERVASANDLQMGENIGQNTPAATAKTMNENGARVFAAIYKRQWRAFRDELRLRFCLNKIYLDADTDYIALTMGEGAMVRSIDYMLPSTWVRPVADPNMVENQQRIAGANMTMGLAMRMPGFNRYNSIRRMLEANSVPDIDEVFPRPQPPEGAPPGTPADLPSPPDPKMLEVQVKQGLLKVKEGELQLRTQEFKSEQMMAAQEFQLAAMECQAKIQKLQAEIMKLQADSMKALAEAKGVETGHMVGILQTQVAANENQIRALELDAQRYQNHADAILKRMDLSIGAMKVMEKAGDVQHKRRKQTLQLIEAGKSAADALAPATPADDGGMGGMAGASSDASLLVEPDDVSGGPETALG